MPYKDPEAKKAYDKVYHKIYRNRNIDAYRARKREYVKLPHVRAKSKEWRHNSLRYKRSELKATLRKYGIGLEEYEKMVVAQNGLCAICFQPETRIFNGKATRLAVDHNHQTQKVRELLCFKCNAAIGYLDESKAKLSSAIDYLDKHKEQVTCLETKGHIPRRPILSISQMEKVLSQLT